MYEVNLPKRNIVVDLEHLVALYKVVAVGVFFVSYLCNCLIFYLETPFDLWSPLCVKPKFPVSPHNSCKPGIQGHCAALGPDEQWQLASPSEREGNKQELSSVMKIFKENNIAETCWYSRKGKLLSPNVFLRRLVV